MKKSTLLLSLTLLLLLTLRGGAFAAQEEIRIALWKLPLNVPAMAALEEKTYEKAFAGTRKVEYVQLPSGPKQIQALAAGALDVSEGIGAPAVLVGAANGADIRVVGVTSRSPKAFSVMVTDPAIKTFADLKGKKVAGLRGSVVHQLFLEGLEEAGLTEKDVEFFPMALSAASSALIAKRVDAALLVGTEALKAGQVGARVLLDGEGRLSGLSLIVVRRAFLEENPQAVRTYLDARRGIVERLEKNPDAFRSLVSAETGLSPQDAHDLMNCYDFDDRITKKDLEELNRTCKYLKNGQYVRKNPDINTLVTTFYKN